MLHTMLSVRRPAVAAAAAIAIGLASVATDARRDPNSGCRLGDDDTAASCGKCHQAIYDEWSGRAHHNAWTDPLFQKWLEGRSEKSQQSCARCHIPVSVLADPGSKPDVREDHLDEGVTCVSCHAHEGKIHGPYGAETDAHPSVKSDLHSPLGSVQMCNSCHRTAPSPVLPIGKDYEKEFASKDRPTCIECHMPEVKRAIANDPETGEPTGPVRMGRRHGALSAGDAEFCASAFEITAKQADGQLVISVENKAGHFVPGLYIRRFEFSVTQLNADGAELATGSFAITGKRKERLPVLSTREYPFELAGGATQVKIVVHHRLVDEKREVDKDLGVVLTKTLDL